MLFLGIFNQPAQGLVMTEWFYARAGQQNGPVTFEQLVELARSGGLTGNDQVWNASMQNWTPAGQVHGLFDTSAMPDLPAGNPANPYAAPQSSWSGYIPTSGVALTEIPPGSELIDPMDCFTRGYDIFRRQFLHVLLVGLVYIACIFALSFVFGIVEAIFKAIFSRGGSTSEDVGTITIVIMFVSQFVQKTVSIFLQLGMARVGLNLVSGKEVSVGMLFGEGSKFLRAFGASILFGIAFLIGLVLLIVPGIYIAMRYGQYMTAIVDRDLGVMESFSYSESITTNNRMNLFVLSLLSLVAVIVGMIPCGLGLLIAGPVVWLAALVAYRCLQYGPNAAKDHPGTQTPMLSSL